MGPLVTRRRILLSLAAAVACLLLGVVFQFATRVAGTTYAFLFGVVLLLGGGLFTWLLIGRRWVRR